MSLNPYAIPATYHDCPSPYQARLGQICEEHYGGVLIDPDAFYREIFPPDTIEHYHKGYPEKPGHRGNPLVLCQRGAYMWPDKKPRWAHHLKVGPEGGYHSAHTKRILFNDYKWLHEWRNLPDCKHVWVSGLTYIGKTRDLNHAVAMHALIFDIDFISEAGLKTFFGSLNYTDDLYPAPNYLVLSGNGMHLYYVFMEPVPLYHGSYGRKVKAQLNQLKAELTRKLWNPYTIGDDEKGRKPQYQGINQAFRMVGSYTKSLTTNHDRYRVIAYKFPQVKPYDSLEPLYRFVDIPQEERYRERSFYGLDFWKQASPDWYERRIVQGDSSVRYWSLDRRLYDWWRGVVREKAEFGHRYNCLFCTVAYAVKCNIPKDELEQDLLDLLPALTARKPDDPITEEDVREAMQAYTPALNTYPVKSIIYLSGIDIRALQTPDNAKKARRNRRSVSKNLELARGIKNLKIQMGEDVAGGRPDLAHIVREWRLAHPDGSKYACVKDTGLSKPTVYKWWEIGDPTRELNDNHASDIDRITHLKEYQRKMQELARRRNGI